MTNVLREWLKAATLAQRKALAATAGTSLPYLNHVAHDRRNCSPALAGRLVAAAVIIRMEGGAQSEESLPVLRLGNICPTCAGCGFYKTGSAAVLK